MKLYLKIFLALCLFLSTGRSAAAAPAPDIDLSQMSGTVVFAMVYDMIWNPANYVGKTIKVSGVYGRYPNTETGQIYHTCIILDATACCAQGIEFELADGAAYPTPDTDITVIGTLDTYRNENLHVADGIDLTQYGINLDVCILRNAELVAR